MVRPSVAKTYVLDFRRGGLRGRETTWFVPVRGLARNVEVKIACQRQEWEEAFQLVGTNYQARGYEPLSSIGLRFTRYHALPDTVVFIAKDDAHVVATLTLVLDNTLLGLPMESTYDMEIRELRRQGGRLVEVTSLADRALSLRDAYPVLLQLMRFMTQYCVSRGATNLVIAVNPRHRTFYRQAMGFVPLGSLRPYPAVDNAPAEALCLNVPVLQASAPRMYELIFDECLPLQALIAPQIPRDLVKEFASRSSQTDVDTISEILAAVPEGSSLRRW
jgi:hypothetical protein